jgi:hypothetical protein
MTVTRDSGLEQMGPNFLTTPCTNAGCKDPRFNCVAYAVGDLTQFWYDVNIKSYHWPPGARNSDAMEAWTDVFRFHGCHETDDRSLEPEYEKIAI